MIHPPRFLGARSVTSRRTPAKEFRCLRAQTPCAEQGRARGELLISAERSKLRENEPHGKEVIEPATDWREGRPP
jgi:hypothetical protein